MSTGKARAKFAVSLGLSGRELADEFLKATFDSLTANGQDQTSRPFPNIGTVAAGYGTYGKDNSSRPSPDSRATQRSN